MDKTEHEAEMLLSSEEVDQEEEEVAECPQTETIIHQQELEPTNQPTWRGALGRFKRWWPVVELKALLKLALPTVSTRLCMLCVLLPLYTHLYTDM